MFYRIHISQDRYCSDPLERAGWTLLSHPYGLAGAVGPARNVLTTGQGRTEREIDVVLLDTDTSRGNGDRSFSHVRERLVKEDLFLLEQRPLNRSKWAWDIVPIEDALVRVQDLLVTWPTPRQPFGLLLPHPFEQRDERIDTAQHLLSLHNQWRHCRVYQRSLLRCADDGEILSSITHRGLFDLRDQRGRRHEATIYSWLSGFNFQEPARLIVVTGSPRGDTLHIVRTWARGKRHCLVSKHLPATVERKRGQRRKLSPATIRDRRLPNVQEDLP